MSHIKVAVFPVAGLGTRFLPATKSVPKEMLPLVDRPLIEYAVEEAREAGIEDFIFITSPGKTALENHFGGAPDLERRLRDGRKLKQLGSLSNSRLPAGTLSFLRQDAPLGLGHAVGLAHRLVGGRPFAVLLPDDVIRAPRGCLSQMVEAHANTGGHMVATMNVAPHDVDSYGILDATDGPNRITHARGLIEKPERGTAPSTLAIVGRYILDPRIFSRLHQTPADQRGEIQLTDALAADIGDLPVTGFRFDGMRFDCGSVAGFTQANLAYALDRPDLREAVVNAIRRHGAPHIKFAA